MSKAATRQAYIRASVQYYGFIESNALVEIFGIPQEQALAEIKAMQPELGLTYSRQDSAWCARPATDVESVKAAFNVIASVQKTFIDKGEKA